MSGKSQEGFEYFFQGTFTLISGRNYFRKKGIISNDTL